jgi:hypothetical protein
VLPADLLSRESEQIRGLECARKKISELTWIRPGLLAGDRAVRPPLCERSRGSTFFLLPALFPGDLRIVRP